MEHLKQLTDLPIFHDDQDGTAIVLGAGLINALKIVNKQWQNLKIVINGAGAAAIASAKLLVAFGVSKEQIYMCDRGGLLVKSRELNRYKSEWAQDLPEQQLAEVIVGADLFIGVSTRDLLSKEMAAQMNKDAIVFAVANPIPEIMPEVAKAAGVRIVGTGRSDYPNQVNNSLGFPGLFRAVLDVRARAINCEMCVAAAKALADLAREPASGSSLAMLKRAYPLEAAAGVFDRSQPLSDEYLIPKQFDLRVVPRVARAVAEAAIATKVNQVKIDDLQAYEQAVASRVTKNWST